MLLLSQRSILAIGAVVDIALHARPHPVSAKVLAARHALPPRHLETVLQALVRHGLLKGVRGPRGGYKLAKERRKVTAGDVVRAAMDAGGGDEPDAAPSKLVDLVIAPEVRKAGEVFLRQLDLITVEELCRNAEKDGVFDGKDFSEDFTI